MVFGFLGGSKRSRPLVLHVDDEKDIRELVAILVSHFGADVQNAENAGDALALARKNRPDMFLVDISMPGVNGFDLCRQLKVEFKGVPILMLTALTQMRDVEKAIAAGADGYIAKPFEPPKMKAKMAEFIKFPEAA
jgi:two-component system response regulator MtrA